MSEADSEVFEAASCRVTLDVAAQTLTFDHSGWGATDEQRARSPIVLPLGAIASVEQKRGRFTTSFWVVRRGDQEWAKGAATDPHGVVCGREGLDFAERVRAAVARATPVDDAESAADDPLPELPPPSWRRRMVGGVTRAVVDGFFNSR